MNSFRFLLVMLSLISACLLTSVDQQTAHAQLRRNLRNSFGKSNSNSGYAPSNVRRKRVVALPQQRLLKLVDQAIEVTSQRYLSADSHSPWQVFHGVVAMRHNFMITVNGKPTSALDWMSKNNPYFNGLPWFEKTAYGARSHRFTEPYHFEGHPNQFMALAAMSDLPSDFQIEVDRGMKVTIDDFVRHSKIDLNNQEEITWTLWFLSKYVDSDEVWTNRKGEVWSIERLVEEQTRAKVVGTACGGTHGLFALAFARNNRLEQGKQLRGVWLASEQKLQRYQAQAKAIQRTDGSFPTRYFRGIGDGTDFSERISPCGHMMEWLTISLPESRLDDEWVRRGIQYIATELIQNQNSPADCGPLYHSLDALVLYRDRARGEGIRSYPLGQPEQELMVEAPTETTTETTEDLPAPAEMKPQEVAQADPQPEQMAQFPTAEKQEPVQPKKQSDEPRLLPNVIGQTEQMAKPLTASSQQTFSFPQAETTPQPEPMPQPAPVEEEESFFAGMDADTETEQSQQAMPKQAEVPAPLEVVEAPPKPQVPITVPLATSPKQAVETPQPTADNPEALATKTPQPGNVMKHGVSVEQEILESITTPAVPVVKMPFVGPVRPQASVVIDIKSMFQGHGASAEQTIEATAPQLAAPIPETTIR